MPSDRLGHDEPVPDFQVLLWNPAKSPYGGHIVQINKTAEALQRIAGLGVRVSNDDAPDWNGVDVVHGFGVTTGHLREARRRGIPVCISTIYWSMDYRTGASIKVPRWREASHRARMAAVLMLAASRGRSLEKCQSFSRLMIETTAFLEAADLLLPNSDLEAACLREELGVSTPVRVVPNAVDPALFPPGPPWEEREGVVYVGRLEPHKNQLGLIEALRGTGVRLTIVGNDHPDHPAYARAVRAKAGALVRLLGPVPDSQLPCVYGGARVHAIPSRFETTGLVSLEAALSGCNIVSTAAGFAREYFGNLAWYCDPYDLKDIRSAVLSALNASPRSALRKRVLEHYTWAHTAAATADAYRDLLNRRL